MGDVTNHYVEVEGGTPAVRERLAEIVNDYLYGPYGPSTITADTMSEEWWEGSVGATFQMQEEFEDVRTEVGDDAFPEKITLIEDAKYEFEGETRRYKRGLGWHAAQSDESGVVVRRDALLKMVAATSTHEGLASLIHNEVGTAWD